MYRTTLVLLERRMQKELAIAFSAEDWGLRPFDLCAAKFRNSSRHFLYSGLLSFGIANNAALTYLLPADFKLWFDQDDRFERLRSRRSHASNHRGKYQSRRDK